MECPICYTITNIPFKFDCTHAICLSCNENIHDRRCPLCRSDIPIRLTRIEYAIAFAGFLCPPLWLLLVLK